MMNNLFSVFDPTTSVLSMAWMAMIFSMTAVPLSMWKMSTNQNKFMKKMINVFKKEVSLSLGEKEKGTETMVMLVFLAILTMNIMALYPQIFAPTSHLSVTLPLSLIFWMTLMLFGWSKNAGHMLSHLLPKGTPPALMMFMVLIELASNIIRPITLCVRLTANLIAGHLLMSLLGNAMMSMSSVGSLLTLPVPLALTILETAVACIQAYVFMTLITLFTTEVK